ncbi:reverse transcriptase domain-containing protein [Arthrobacter psychrochitiniphilus]|uniref:reverse transcriptase domain-containing protein n=1 Tax=Arthrobacter psychrochitiniphilus TaxID=291045 RepID=UPI003F7B9EC6
MELNCRVINKQTHSISSLKHIYENDLAGTVITTRDGQTKASFDRTLESELTLIRDRLQRGNYRFTSYQEKLILKGPSSLPRRISIPTTRDRIALKAIQYELSSYFPEAKTELPQTKIQNLRKVLKSDKYDSFIRLDIENFFPSISHKFIHQQLVSRRIPHRLIRPVMAALETPTLPKYEPNAGFSNRQGIPQGICIASQIAELCMIPIDSTIKNNESYYFDRYVDDVIVFCAESEVKTISENYSNFLIPIGIKVHPFETDSKSAFGKLDQPFDYLGYSIRSRGKREAIVLAKDSSLRRFERRLAKLFTQYTYSRPFEGNFAYFGLKWRLKLVTNGCFFDGQKRGWLHYFSQMTSASQAHRLDGIIDKFTSDLKLPALRQVSFRDMYWNIRNKSTRGNLICDFSNLSRDEMQEILHKVFRRNSTTLDFLSDDSLRALFQTVLRKEIAELETDVSPVS